MPFRTMRLAEVNHDLYDGAMAEMRVPDWLWRRFADVVGDVGRTADLKQYMGWQIDNPDQWLGDDVEPPHDFPARLRVDNTLWQMFMDTVGEGFCSSRLRAYIWWRVQNPEEPLPGRRVPPIRRDSRQPIPV